MFLSIQELDVRKVQFDEDFPAGEIDFGVDQLRQVGNLHAEGQAELLNDTLGEIRVKGKLRVELEMPCDRCLDTARHVIDEPFDLFYRPAPKAGLPHDLAIDEGEAQIGFYEGGGMELSEVLREHILLSLPMHLLCREDCAGICPQCGENRNLAVCGCTQAKIDDRWAALRNLRGGLPSETKQ